MAGHKWWRIININSLDKTKGNWDVGAYKVKFISQSEIISSNPAKISVQSINQQSWTGNVADLISSSDSSNVVVSASDNKKPWWVSYEFDNPEILSKIYYKPWADWGYEWQTADIEYSDDGINWRRYGKVSPLKPKSDATALNMTIILYPAVSGISMQDNNKPSSRVLVFEWNTGNLLETIVPAQDGSWSIGLANQTPVLVTHIGEEGYRPISDGPIIPQVSI